MTWQPPSLPADHPPVRSGGIGVLLVNLGTPDAPTAVALLHEVFRNGRVELAHLAPHVAGLDELRSAILTAIER